MILKRCDAIPKGLAYVGDKVNAPALGPLIYPRTVHFNPCGSIIGILAKLPRWPSRDHELIYSAITLSFSRMFLDTTLQTLSPSQ